jgi:hypothetical protein
MPMTKQQEKVYRYIMNNRGCTTHDIVRDTFIQKPCARISELRALGVKVVSIGHKKYPGSKAFEMYAIEEPLMKVKSVFEIRDGVAFERKITVPL